VASGFLARKMPDISLLPAARYLSETYAHAT
jgi:hypothetical protein